MSTNKSSNLRRNLLNGSWKEEIDQLFQHQKLKDNKLIKSMNKRWLKESN